VAGYDKHSENRRFGRLPTTYGDNGGSSSSTRESRATSATVSILNANALKNHLLVFEFSKQDSYIA